MSESLFSLSLPLFFVTYLYSDVLEIALSTVPAGSRSATLLGIRMASTTKTQPLEAVSWHAASPDPTTLAVAGESEVTVTLANAGESCFRVKVSFSPLSLVMTLRELAMDMGREGRMGGGVCVCVCVCWECVFVRRESEGGQKGVRRGNGRGAWTRGGGRREVANQDQDPGVSRFAR